MFMGECMKNNIHKSTFLKDYTPPAFFIKSADLQFILDPKKTIVNAKLHITRNPNDTNNDSAITLDGINVNLQTLKLNERLLSKVDYKITPEHLTILQVPDNFILETTVEIHPEKNLTCSGLYLTDGNFCTQNEPYGFRRITYFIDQPDIPTKFTTTIIADKTKYPILLSNGNLISQEELPDNRHSATWQDPFPKSCYLFALVAGKFGWIEDFYTTNSGRKITLRIFARKKQLQQCHHAMSSLKQAMAWDEKTFGLEYDLDIYQIVAVDDFNFGAMENKSLNIFNTSVLLASQTTTTDADFNRVTEVIAHEYFHNWTGNRVTCRDWFQLGLKEGLTTLREQLFMEDMHGQAINRINSVKTMLTRQFAEDFGPLSHPIRLQSYITVNNFYTATVYDKSAEVARMLITIFGRTTFQQIMTEFLRKYDGQAITIEDFLQTATQITKTNLDQFKLWYDQAGTPILNVSDEFTNSKTYVLKTRQEHHKTKEDFYIPLTIGLVSVNGENILNQNLIIDKKEQNFSFENLTTKPIPSLSRNFSAPIKINYTYSDNDLMLLMCHDKDPVNAWNAGQQLITNTTLRLYDNMLAQQPYSPFPALMDAYRALLGDNKIDLALKAQILKFPTENYLLEAIPQADIEAMHHASEFVKLEIAKTLKTELLECYKNNCENKPYTLDAISVGKRDLKNLCLYYLMHLNSQEIFDICLQQLEHANNMTDTLACLTAIANSHYPKREQILEDYYQKWEDHPNLVNKWLTINATIKLFGTLEHVQKLTQHQAFNITNPNKVYALIRTFCEQNHINFHEAKGAGYKFLADQVLAIDKFNPHLAAIIVVPLTRGHKHNKVRQQLLKQELLRISQDPDLSKNVYELVAKSIK